MKNLVNIEDIINNIKQKLQSYNFDFNEFEIEIIMNDYKLFNEFINILTNDYNVWSTISSSVYEFLKVNYEVDYSQEFLKKYMFFLIDKGIIDNILETTFASKEFEQEIKDYLRKKLSESSYIPDIKHPSKDLLEIIIELNRVDLLKNIKHIEYIYQDTLEQLKIYYSNNDLIIPDAIFSQLKDFKCSFKKLTLKSIFKYLETNNKLDNDEYKTLLHKIKTEERLKEYNFNWDVIFTNFDEQQKEEVLNILLENGYYEVIGQLSNLTSNSTFINKFIDAIIVNDNPEVDILDFTNNNNYLYLLNNEKVLQALIKKGKLLSASHSDLFKDYKEIAIDVIKKNPDIFKNINIQKFKDLKMYPDIIFVLYLIGNDKLNPYIKTIPELREKVKISILNGESNNIPATLANDDEFINQLISSGKEKILVEKSFLVKRNGWINLTNENLKIIIEKCKIDVKFAMRFLNCNIFTVINNKELLNFFLNANNQAIEVIINRLNHLEENRVKYTDEMFEYVKQYLINKYKLNEKNFELFEKHFGPLVIRYINNENIQQIINLNDVNFNKLLELFPKVEFNMSDAEKIYDSLKQFAFSKIYSADTEIFARINHLIADNNSEYIHDLDKIISTFETQSDKEKFYKKFNNMYPHLLKKIMDNPKEFLINVIEYIQNGTNEEKNYYLNVLHFITDYYIAYKREKYRDEYDMQKDLSIPYVLDDKDKTKQFIKHYAVRIYKNLIKLEMQDLGIDEELASDCIEYYGYDKRDFSDTRLIEIKKLIKVLVEITNKILKVTGMPNAMIENLDSERLIKRKYYVETNNGIIYAILSELNVDTLKNTVLESSNSHLYESLKKYMNKYKLHLIPDYFKELMSSEYIDINVEVADIASFISYYAQIYEEESKRLHNQGKSIDDLNLSYTLIMKYAETYSSVSDIYNQILGIDDARIIKRNPGPNAATRKTSDNARLKEAVEWTLNNYKRTEVTIPPLNEVLSDNEKSIRVIVGNFTHPANVTMGERTGSCMRIGGAGDTLFDFVLSDKNGFHIRFENPDTGEFISRVSGFRNGNTVFLNELRCSCNPEEYSNQDIVNFCKETANMLVNQSSESECPIENVVLHNDYATKNLSLKEEYLNIDDNRTGLKNFYCDIKDKAIILASTEIPFAKVNFDKSNVPNYLPAREACYKSTDSKKLRIIINRVHAIKYALKGINYEYIAPIDFKKEIQYGIANQDFYIFIDVDGNIYEEIIDIDQRALLELEEARKIIYDIKKQEIEDIKRI